MNVILFCLFFINLYHKVVASTGDYSNEFRGCYHTCHFNQCSSNKSIRQFHEKQSIFEKLLFWSCEDECKYSCMWHATTVFENRGWGVPQFYGKWPFIRFGGLQEPASVAFSALNFLAQYSAYKSFRAAVPREANLFYVWTAYFWISLNAWVWSIVFHARDNLFTEQMDYFCAFSMVLISFVVLLLRVSGKKNIKLKVFIIASSFLFFSYHIWYLSTRSFDYGYNMKVNVAIGVINGLGWLWWSWSRSNDRPYLYWCRVTVLVAGSTMILELMDFSPILWTFDAHSLWHLSTSILPSIWVKFIQEDCLYLMQNDSRLKKEV